MPLTVVTLKKVPQSLRGDLTKWMQEIATGVYVGNFNSKVRENLWERIVENVHEGEATITYACRNEIGYTFETKNSSREMKLLDGIPIVNVPLEISINNEGKLGFSNAAKFRKARKYTKIQSYRNRGNNTIYASKIDVDKTNVCEGNAEKIDVSKIDKTVKSCPLDTKYISIDIETDGLDKKNNRIIELGAYTEVQGESYAFQRFLEYDGTLPKEITKFTGITETVLRQEGVSRKEAFENFLVFIGNCDLLGYSINFDIGFINNELLRLGFPQLNNRTYDLLDYVKREKLFIGNYKLATVLESYDINENVEHKALSDAKVVYDLSLKVNKFRQILS